MSLLHSKLNADRSTYAQIQFFGGMVGLVSAMYFFSQGRQGAEINYQIAAVISILTLDLTGLCNFFIHRGDSYQEYKSNDEEIRQYETRKGKHDFNFVVAVNMFLFACPLVWVIDRSHTAAQSVSGWKFTVFCTLGGIGSIALFAIGAHMGEWGWRFKESDKPGYIPPMKPGVQVVEHDDQVGASDVQADGLEKQVDGEEDQVVESESQTDESDIRRDREPSDRI